MEHWPGHERRERAQKKEDLKDKGKQKGHSLEPDFWQWPHLEHGSIGRATLVSKDGRVQWSTLVDASRDTRWSPLGKPAMVFPQTRPPPVNINEHSLSQRADRGIQYLRSHFPDAEFPSELLVETLEADVKEMRRLRAFDPFFGNLLEIVPSHHTPDEITVAFPMDELGRQLNISRFCPDLSGNMTFIPAGAPSFAFETPILQISSAVGPSEQTAASSALLVRTYTSSSLLRVEHSAVTRELDITRAETGDIPIVDSRILASGPDIVVVNRNGNVYKCNIYHGGKAMQSIGPYENSGNEANDPFWQLGITGRSDECFLASWKVVKRIDTRSADAVAGIFTVDHSSDIVTSFESPMRDYISRITTTSEVVWLDDRFRRRPLLSFKHYRGFDRTLRMLTANLSGASISLLTSRRNNLVTIYDVNRCPDRLLHCNSIPSCLPNDGPMLIEGDGHAVAALPSDVELAFFRLHRRGHIYRQDVRVSQDNEDQLASAQDGRVTHQWDEEIDALAERSRQLHVDHGPAGERDYMKVNLRGAYERMCAAALDTEGVVGENSFRNLLAQLPDVWQSTEFTDTMLTTLDAISSIAGGDGLTCYSINENGKQGFATLNHGQTPIQELANLAQWHYSIQDTSIPVLTYPSADSDSLREYLKELDLVFGSEKENVSVRSETNAREQLVLDLALSNDIYTTKKIFNAHSLAAGEATANTTVHPKGISYSEEPPEIQFGYFCPIRKSGADHYTNKDGDGEEETSISSPLGVRLLLTEWELGTDPNNYTYQDPYGVADIDEQPTPQYRKPPASLPPTQKKQMPLQRPPTVVAAATQSPVVQAVERLSATTQSQAVHRTHSQQVVPSPDAFLQEPLMNTQVLPGPFGGRPAAGKKPIKKRTGGF